MKTRETPRTGPTWATPPPSPEPLSKTYAELLQHIDDELDAQIWRDLTLIARSDERKARWRRLFRRK